MSYLEWLQMTEKASASKGSVIWSCLILLSCRTFDRVNSSEDLIEIIRELCHSLFEETLNRQFSGKTITVKFKTVDFRIFTRSFTSKVGYFRSFEDIFDAAMIVNMYN